VTVQLENLPVSVSSRAKKYSTNTIIISEHQPLRVALHQIITEQTKGSPSQINAIANRIANEVERICHKSDRIQSSGVSDSWLLGLARHRLSKCLYYT
jgi:hypothetical protein